MPSIEEEDELSEHGEQSYESSKRQKLDPVESKPPEPPSKMASQIEPGQTSHKLTSTFDAVPEDRNRSVTGSGSKSAGSKEPKKRQAEVEGKDRINAFLIEILHEIVARPNLSNFLTVAHCHSLIEAEFESSPLSDRLLLADRLVKIYLAYTRIGLTGEEERQVLLKQMDILDTLINIYMHHEPTAAA